MMWMLDALATLLLAPSVPRAARDVCINACKSPRRDLEGLASAGEQLREPGPLGCHGDQQEPLRALGK